MPHELLYGVSPLYDQLRVFESLCYVTNTSLSKTKFQLRAQKCIFIVYAITKKAYKLYDLISHQVVISRDVVFHEHIFPFATIPPVTTSVPLPTGTPQTDSEYTYDPPTSSAHTPTYNSEVSPPSTTIQIAHSPHSALSEPPLSSPLLVRRSSRITHRLARFNDIVCHLIYPSLLQSCNTSYVSFVAALSILQEPTSYAHAVKCDKWREAMQCELDLLERNHTWSKTSLPNGKHAIGCKWVFKLKLNADGTIDRYKARLVAKGFN
ncbi:UNVERIFIED_CONTAM: Retrovirus-related Pol polyprotein from transposon RE1 [Sesamum radiatum]|uniref:Retrovirus-related Pol polyprotein from transposon RE1 n=1 Tax=Sesamum radiatum TaxID=300843 RepID=A0AAW2KAI2_SESRA